MMDIGAYESEQMVHHSSGYHSIETTYDYDYFHQNNQNNFNNLQSNANAQHVGQHSHLYSPSAGEFGINMPAAADQTFHSYENSAAQNFYMNGSGQANLVSGQQNALQAQMAAAAISSNNALPDSYIINSDNGLSYTNLDLMYNQPSGSAGNLHLLDDHKPFASAAAPESGEVGPQTHPHAVSTPMLPSGWSSHYPTYNLDYSNRIGHYGDTIAAMNSGLPGSAKDAAGRRAPMRLEANHNNHLEPLAPGHRKQQQPTYKWMQVKRNVPKPAGKARNQNDAAGHTSRD